MKIVLTGWYLSQVSPVRPGLYQVKTNTWPWVTWSQYSNGRWSDTITHWRGLSIEFSNSI